MRAQLGGKRFLREVERHPRHRPVVVLSDALLQLGAELGVALQQMVEGRLVQSEQPARLDRLDGGRTRLALEERELAEEVAAAQVPDVAPASVLLDEDPEPAFLDDVHRARRVPLSNDALAG